jgi:putative nucleotidyltransferase with HDIG domain
MVSIETESGEIGITRDKAVELLTSRLTNKALVKHCLATEAIMRTLAERFNEDPDMWGIAGLLHDLDYDETKEEPKKHGLITEKILAEEGINPKIIEAIKSHNADVLGMERTDTIHYAITAAENITGLIVATALVMPDKKISQVKPKSVIKRMKEKHFARAVDREGIRMCEAIDIPLEEFVQLSLGAMGGIADDLGL